MCNKAISILAVLILGTLMFLACSCSYTGPVPVGLPEVYDDEGEIITKEEIRKEIGTRGTGCIGCDMLSASTSLAISIASQWDFEIAEIDLHEELC